MYIARNGDKGIGTCSCHKNPRTIVVTLIASYSNKLSNNLGTIRLNDKCISSCGHLSKIITSSSKVKAKNLGIARVGDRFLTVCSGGIITGTIIAGSNNIMIT